MKEYPFGVICGNSDEIVDQLIESGMKYDLILTDPPYNINKDFGNKSDCLSLEDFINITKTRVQKLKKLLTPTGSIIWFGIHDYICYVQVAMYDAGLYYRRMNIWHYENGFSRSKKEPATHYEPFLWFSNDKKMCIPAELMGKLERKRPWIQEPQPDGTARARYDLTPEEKELYKLYRWAYLEMEVILYRLTD